MMHFNMPGVTTKQYDQVWADLRAAGHANPKGLIYHVGSFEGNNLMVIDIWESQEAFFKFSEILMPILKMNNFPEVQPVITPVHNEFSGKQLSMA